MWKKRWSALGLALCLAFLWGMPSWAVAEQADWTVLLYLCGTDLESDGGYASINLLELMEAKGSKDVQVVVQTGGTREWQLEGINPRKLQRFALEDGEFEQVDERPLASMGDGQTLADFIAWGAAAYPADKTMLIIWDHGGGSVWGVANDELYDGDPLFTPELAWALEEAGVSLEVIGFDACLMATLEVAAALSGHARYLVASEEIEPGTGWDYEALLSYLMENPGADGLQVGRVICDSFYEKSSTNYFADITTLSVVDLSEIPGLVAAFQAMAAEMTGVTGDIEALRTFKQGVRRAESYGGNTPSEGYSNMVDLGDLTIKTQSVLPDTALDVLGALFSAVKYQVSGDRRTSANGLAVFFPLSATEDELEIYGEVGISDDYFRFVTAYSGLSSSGGGGAGGLFGGTVQQPESSDSMLQQLFSHLGMELADDEDYPLEFHTYFNEDNAYCLEFLEGFEIVENVEFSLFYIDTEDEELIEMGYDNDLYADWDNGTFEDNFYGYWPTIEGYPCALYLIGEGEDYNLYSIPIKLNEEEVSLRAVYVWEEEDEYFEILGVWRGVDEETGMSDRDYQLLSEGDEVRLLFTAYPFDSDEELLYSMGTFTVEGDVVMEMGDLFDGQYLFSYEVETIFGDIYYSESVIMEMEDGEIYVDWLEDE